MTIGAQEVMNCIDELQLCFTGRGGVVGGPLTLNFGPQGSYSARGHPMTTGALEVMTIDELQFHFGKDSPGGI